MTRRTAAVLVVLALALAGFLLLRDPGVPVRVAAVTRGPLRVSVSCAGVLQPPPGGELRAPESATVARLLVAEGARVERGQALLELGDPDLVARARQSREEALQVEAESSAAA